MSVGRLVRSADFEKVLQSKVVARSDHFALHHAPGIPSRPAGRKLSTEAAPECVESVDDSAGEVAPGRWLGTVVPKRHARAAVTRSLMKRQMRRAMQVHAMALPAGLWVVRLRAPFDRKRFTSAASEALREAARAELDVAFARAGRRPA